jgi:hypothetical protein
VTHDTIHEGNIVAEAARLGRAAGVARAHDRLRAVLEGMQGVLAGG